MKHASQHKKNSKRDIYINEINPEHKDSVNVLFNQIISSIHQNKLDEAEHLRQQLFKLDSRAVHEIFEAGRLIDRARKKLSSQLGSKRDTPFKGINRIKSFFRPVVINENNQRLNNYPSTPSTVMDGIGFNARWFMFANCFTHDELYNLINYLHSVQCRKKHTILQKGNVNRRLFFIESGSVKISDLYKNTDRNIILSGGDIVGDLSFFSGIHHPFSATAQRGTVFKYFDYSDMQILKNRFPDFDRSLHALCIGHKSAQGVKGPVILPRFYKRVDVPGIVSIQRINTRGSIEGSPFRGRLLNISQGGYAFQFNSADDSEMRTLNGAPVNAALDIKRSRPWDDILWRGTVVRVKKTEPGLYSVHVRGLYPNRKVTSLLKQLIC